MVGSRIFSSLASKVISMTCSAHGASIFPLQVLGAKPVVDVDQDVVEFDRLLLGKKLQKTLTLKNNSAIPANWKLSGIDELPEEFNVNCREGKLAPCAEQVIEITFEAKEEKILDPTI
jgi:hydrocephalus-inducing protein